MANRIPTPNVSFIRERLIPALESNAYVQGKGQLRDASDRFCCLGVACDLLVQDGKLSWVRDDFDDHFAWRAVDSISGPTGTLPHTAQMVLGLSGFGARQDEERDYAIGNNRYGDLAQANDEGRTFFEIAGALRQMCDEIEAAEEDF